jgi:ABC-type nitrate/sulfonate/bicarbonate transport system substrate-binding protein
VLAHIGDAAIQLGRAAFRQGEATMLTLTDRSTRRRFIAGAGGALGAAALLPHAAAQQLEKLVYVTPFGYLIDFAPILNAHAGGHFKAQGFDSEIVGGKGGMTSVQQLVAKQAKFSRNAPIEFMKAYSATKVPLLAVATIMQASVFHLISAKSAPIREAADLKGKTIGVVSVGGATENLLDLILLQAGIAKADVPRNVAGNSPGSMALIRQGRIQGFVATVNVVIALKLANEAYESWSTDRYAPMPSQVYLTHREVAEKEPGTVVRFLKAVNASVKELLAATDKGPILDRMAKAFEIPGVANRPAMLEALKFEDELMLAQGRENVLRNVPALWAKGAELLNKAGLAKIDKVEDLYTNKFVDEALK